MEGLAKLSDDADEGVASRTYSAIKSHKPERFEALVIQNLGSKEQAARLIALKQCPVTLVPTAQKAVLSALEAVMLASKGAPVEVQVLREKLGAIPGNEESCAWLGRTFLAVADDPYEDLLTQRMLAIAGCEELPKHFVSSMDAGLKHRSITKRVRAAATIMNGLDRIKVSQSDLTRLEITLTFCLDREIDVKLKSQLNGPCLGAKARIASLKKK